MDHSASSGILGPLKERPLSRAGMSASFREGPEKPPS
jgi:hypothetical protein